MGLDVSHDAWSGSYGGFSTWRHNIAEAAELDLASLWAKPWPHENYDGDWATKEPDDILYVLLIHSDCDGKIERYHAGPLADRLEGLLPNLGKEGPNNWTRQQTVRFIDGLRLASKQGMPLEFW